MPPWGAPTFNASLTESWEAMPELAKVSEDLEAWGILDDNLSPLQLQERWVRFSGIDLGIAPAAARPAMLRQLLEFEQSIACR